MSIEEAWDLLADNQSSAGRLVTSAVVIVVAAALGWLVGRIMARRADDAYAKYYARKGARYASAVLAVIVLAIVWRAFAGRAGVVLGLATAGIAFAMQEVIGAIAGWFNIMSGRIFRVAGQFDKILDIKHCYLQDTPSNEIRLAVKDFAFENNVSFYDIHTNQGLLRNLIIRTSSTGESMVILQVGEENETGINGLMKHLQNLFPEITSLNYVVNTKKNETFHDLDVVCFSGKPFITEQMEGFSFRIGPKSFYQTNSSQAYELYKVARDFAGLSGNEIVYDLYTGTGTIAQFVSKQAKKVVGIEFVEAAIEDAKTNASLNNIENCVFYAGDIKDVLQENFISKEGKPDVIITDPPRAGMHVDVVNALLSIKAQKIIYVSCNPATQARDLALLDQAYIVKAVQPVDMFPHTYHVENVVLLERREHC